MIENPDPFNLERYVSAQNDVFDNVTRELYRGKKETHWMWFVFPQLKGLGYSHTAKNFSIRSLDEAKAYLGQPVLGSRLEDCTDMVLDHSGKHITNILGTPDDYKFRSSMTLFSLISPRESIYHQALATFFNGQ